MSNYTAVVTGLSAPAAWNCLVLIGITFSPRPPCPHCQYSLSAVYLLKGGQV